MDHFKSTLPYLQQLIHFVRIKSCHIGSDLSGLRGATFNIQEGAWKFFEIKNVTHLMSKKTT